jgi:hypothetical protein
VVVVGSGVFALTATLYDQSLGVGELNVDVLLGDARKLTIKVVGILALTNVEPRGERGGRRLAASRAVAVVVVQETEKRGEIPRAWEAGTEERHGVLNKVVRFVFEELRAVE